MEDSSPRFIHYRDLREGSECQRDYALSPAVYEGFLAAFGDLSPIHIDAEFARSHGFSGRVMHGAILNGFLSHFVGMVFPGSNSLLLSVDIRFSQPSYLEDCLRLHGKIAQKLDVQQVVVLDFTFSNQTRGGVAARGRAQIQLRSN